MTENTWKNNTGNFPDELKFKAKIDVELRNGAIWKNLKAGPQSWGLSGSPSDIVRWRLH